MSGDDYDVCDDDCGNVGKAGKDMEKDFKAESRKQYLKYFRFWFLAVGILVIISAGVLIKNAIGNNRTRTNLDAPIERVYDYADVLTDEQEESLRDYIAKAENKCKADIVLVTTKQPMEGESAKEKYGYRSIYWEQNMMDVADDFWDKNKFGFNKGFEGDGALLLSNWYEGQAGEHLSTSGSVENAFSVGDIDYLLNRVGHYIEGNPYRAYVAYVDSVVDEMTGGKALSRADMPMMFVVAFVFPTIVALIYMCINLNQKKAKDTTTASTYVAGGRPVLVNKSDRFLRKHVSSRRIETSSSSGGSHRSGGGGGGHHRSSSGASHGGGSRRR